MDESTLHAPLTSEELDKLADFLDSIPDNAMTLEMLDGFFVALICGPEPVPPSEYLPVIWGETFEFGADAQVEGMLPLIMRHWHVVAHTLSHARAGQDLYEPVLFEDDDGNATAHDWADGFMLGVDMRRDSWDRLFNDEERGGLLVPILMLHHEAHPELDDEPSSLTHQDRETAIQYMVGGLVPIYRYFAPYRTDDAVRVRTPLRRDSPKVGRNDPCPCGSGRKYKQCCGKSPDALH
jgi:uncharacterized protein